MSMWKILLVDNHPLFRTGLRRIVDQIRIWVAAPASRPTTRAEPKSGVSLVVNGRFRPQSGYGSDVFVPRLRRGRCRVSKRRSPGTRGREDRARARSAAAQLSPPLAAVSTALKPATVQAARPTKRPPISGIALKVAAFSGETLPP